MRPPEEEPDTAVDWLFCALDLCVDVVPTREAVLPFVMMNVGEDIDPMPVVRALIVAELNCVTVASLSGDGALTVKSDGC